MEERRKPSLVLSSQMPVQALERFITSGYRSPGYSAAQCLRSAFMCTNETLNFWTHFLPLFVCLAKFWQLLLLQQQQQQGDAQQQLWPLCAYAIGVCFVFTFSSVAHLFNAMSLRVRDLCYYFDYGAVSIYGAGASIAYYHYVNPSLKVLDRGFMSEWLRERSPRLLDPNAHGVFCALLDRLFKPLAFAFSVVCTVACCLSRLKRCKHRYAIRTLVFLLPQTLTLPVTADLLVFWPDVRHITAAFAANFVRHFTWLFLAALFNISKLPERCLPGAFDIVGHSHQWFHLFTFLAILDEMYMIEEAMSAHLGGLPGAAPDFASTVGFMLALIGCTWAIIYVFSRFTGRRADAGDKDK
uniref:Membrane progestin receptor epsilon n=2 Tax=Petromyzon marinus TaxID=7757 RepID=A0AAJ7U775_PETMA|nr:membrane progestin receptor epsilon [Petromyzon marinus]